jgi:hypothetical protein
VNITAEKLQFASMIDAKVKSIGRPEGEQHENHGVVASLATPAATISKNQRIVVFRLIQ